MFWYVQSVTSYSLSALFVSWIAYPFLPPAPFPPTPPPPPPKRVQPIMPYAGVSHPLYPGVHHGWHPFYHGQLPLSPDPRVVEIVEPPSEDDSEDKSEKKKRRGKKQKESKEETSLEPVVTSYQAFTLERADPLPGDKQSWARVGARPLPFADVKIVDLVKKHRRKSGTTPMQDFATLASNQQGVINRVLADKTTTEAHPNAMWSLVDVQKLYSVRGWTKDLHKIQIVLKRHASDKARSLQEGSSSKRRYQFDEIIDLSTAPLAEIEVKEEADKKKANKHRTKMKNVSSEHLTDPVENMAYLTYDNHYAAVEEPGCVEQQHGHHQYAPEYQQDQYQYAPEHQIPQLPQHQLPVMPHEMYHLPPGAPEPRPEHHQSHFRAPGNPFMPFDNLVPPEAPMPSHEWSARHAPRLRASSSEPPRPRKRDSQRQKQIEILEGEVEDLRNRMEGLTVQHRPTRLRLDTRAYSAGSPSMLSFSSPTTPTVIELVPRDSLRRDRRAGSHLMASQTREDGLDPRRLDDRPLRSPRRRSRLQHQANARHVVVHPFERPATLRPEAQYGRRLAPVLRSRTSAHHAYGLRRRQSDGSINLLPVEIDDSTYDDLTEYEWDHGSNISPREEVGRRNRHRTYRRASDHYDY